jgi:Cu2+-exporting ATPase
MSTTVTCSHCGLPLGCLGQHREVNGESLAFCCYGCCLAYQVQHGAHEEPQAAALLIRLGVGAFFAMNVMLFSLLLYANAFIAAPELGRLIPWLLWALATPLLIMLGGPFISGAWRALREGRMGSDTLVAVAAVAGYGYSAWQVINGSDLIYFDTTTMVLMLFTLGRYLEAQARARTARTLAPILAAEHAQVRLVVGDSEIMQPISEVKAGDVVRTMPGERIAVDGEVITGHSSCEETILTGQLHPQYKQPGSHVHAGSINGSGQLLIRTSENAGTTRWIHISRMVRAALAHKSGVAETVDRVAAWFVPGVLLLAAGTFGVWSVLSGPNQAMLYSMAVLVVACPCSLGLAAPLAATLGLGRAARRGIVIRGAGILEKLARLHGIAFDKTGTLTHGQLRPLTLRTHRTTATDALRYAKALAHSSSHPVARAVAAMKVNMPAAAAQEVVVTPGAGITGQIDGMTCALGSERLMESLGWTIPESLKISSATPSGVITVYAGWRDQVHARIDLDDTVRPEARDVITALKARGLRTLVLSGDGHAEVERISAALGIDEWQAELLPETKLNMLQYWQTERGALAMVGDEMNDGPVLAAAQVGIAVGEASDFAKESADVTLPHDGFANLPWLLDLALEVRRSTRANLIWAFGYNAIALALAASGHLQPILAAALMAGSSLLVVTRSIRSNRRAGNESG